MLISGFFLPVTASDQPPSKPTVVRSTFVLRPLNPFLRHHFSQHQPHASHAFRRVGACAAGFAVSISLSLAQDAPVEADPAPADAGLGFGIVPADGVAPAAPADASGWDFEKDLENIFTTQAREGEKPRGKAKSKGAQ